MSLIATVVNHSETMSGRAAQIMLGVTRNGLLKLAAMGHIRTAAEMGSCIRFVRVDVEFEARRRGRLPESGNTEELWAGDGQSQPALRSR